MLLEYLKSRFDPGKPIFVSDAAPLGLSAVNLRQQFKKLVDAHRLVRCDPGVYFLPDETGEYSDKPSANMIAERKYIRDGREIFGYYSGYTFANRIGICLQVPYKEEIVTNRATAAVRQVEIGNVPFLVRRPRTTVTCENRDVLQLLDLLKDVEGYTDHECEAEAPELIREHIRRNGIARAQVDRFIGLFPLKTYKNIYDLRLADAFA